MWRMVREKRSNQARVALMRKMVIVHGVLIIPEPLPSPSLSIIPRCMHQAPRTYNMHHTPGSDTHTSMA